MDMFPTAGLEPAPPPKPTPPLKPNPKNALADYVRERAADRAGRNKYALELTDEQRDLMNRILRETPPEFHDTARRAFTKGLYVSNLYGAPLPEAIKYADMYIKPIFPDYKSPDSVLGVLGKSVENANYTRKLGNAGALMMTGDEKAWREYEDLKKDMPKNDIVYGSKISEYLGITANSAALMAPGIAAGFIHPLLGAAVNFALNTPMYMGLAYIDMIESGIDKNTAKSYASASGAVQSVIEAALGFAPVEGIVKAALGKTAAKTLLAKGTVQDLSKTISKRAAFNAALNLVTSPMEGVEEAAQAIASNMYLEMAAVRGQSLYNDIDWNEIEARKQDLLEEFEGGVAMALILGVPMGFISGVRGAGQAKKIAADIEAAVQTAPTVEEAQKAVEAAAGEFLTPESVVEVSRLKFNELEEKRNADWEKALSETPQRQLEPASESPGPYVKTDEGKPLVSFKEPSSADGAAAGVMTISSPRSGARYGRIEYRFDEAENTLSVDAVDVRDYIDNKADMITAAALELRDHYPGVNLKWRSNDVELDDVKSAYGAENKKAKRIEKAYDVLLENWKKHESALKEEMSMGAIPPYMRAQLKKDDTREYADTRKEADLIDLREDIQEWKDVLARNDISEAERTAAQEELAEKEGELKQLADAIAIDRGTDDSLSELNTAVVDRILRTPEIRLKKLDRVHTKDGRTANGLFVYDSAQGAVIQLKTSASMHTYLHEKIHAIARTLTDAQLKEWEALKTGIDLKTKEGQEDFVDLMMLHLKDHSNTGSRFFDFLLEKIRNFIRELRKDLSDNLTPAVKRYLDSLISDPAADAPPQAWNDYFKPGKASALRMDDGGEIPPETAARILEKIKAAKPVEITGKEITPSADLKEYKKNALEYGKALRGRYTNKDTEKEIELTRKALKEILEHDYKTPEHIQSIAAIPQIIENGVYLGTFDNEAKDARPEIKSYDYYIAGLKIGGKDYTVKSVTASDAYGNKYYDHKLTEIEKGKLLALSFRITSPATGQTAYPSHFKDKRLYQILKQLSNNINPDQAALLEGPNDRSLPPGQDDTLSLQKALTAGDESGINKNNKDARFSSYDTQLSPDSPQKSRGGENENPSGASPEDTAILYELSDEETERQAVKYGSWQEWKKAAAAEAADGLINWYDVVPEDVVGWEEDEWFKAQWERFHNAPSAKASAEGDGIAEADELFIDKIHSGRNLESFLVELYYLLNPTGRVFEDNAKEKQRVELGYKADELVSHPSIRENAKRLVQGQKDLTPQSRKRVLTLLERAAPYYRDIYAELMNDTDLLEYKGRHEDEFEAAAAERRDMSAYEKKRFARRLKDAGLAKKYMDGAASEADLKEYVDAQQREIDALNSESAALKSYIDVIKKDLSWEASNRVKYAALSYKREKQLEKLEKRITGLEERLKETRKRGIDARKAQRERTAAAYENKIDRMRRRADKLRYEADVRAKADAGLRRTDAEAKAVEHAIALEKLREGLTAKQKKRDAGRKLYAEQRKIVEGILKEPAASIDLKYQEKIRALQDFITAQLMSVKRQSKTVNVDGKSMSVDEFRALVVSGKYKPGFLSKGLQDRFTRRNFTELSLNELTGLRDEVDSLRAEGRAAWKNREEMRRLEERRLTRYLDVQAERLVAEGKTGAAKRMRKIRAEIDEKKRNRIASGADALKWFYTAINDNNLVNLMDGGADGALKDVLINPAYKAYNEKFNNYDRRLKGVLDLAKSLNIDIDALSERNIPLAGAGADNTDIYLSKAQLMLLEIGLDNPEMCEHIIYGNLFSDAERNAWRAAQAAGGGAVRAQLEAKGLRKEAALRDAAIKNLSASERRLAQAVADDFDVNFPRLREMMYTSMNEDVSKQANYLPMLILSGAGDGRSAAEQSQAALTAGTYDVKVSPDKGMTIDRVKNIPRWAQTPVELDIFKVFFKGVEKEEHLIAYAPLVRKLNNIFRGRNSESKALREKLSLMYGDWALKRLQERVNLLAVPQSASRNDVDDLTRTLAGKSALAQISFNISSALAQFPQSIAPFFGFVSPAYMLQAARVYAKNRDFAADKSAVLRHREINYAQEYMNAVNFHELNKADKVLMKGAKAGMALQQFADRACVHTGWTAVYMSELKKGRSEEEAVHRADEVVNATSPNMDQGELSPLFRSKGGGIKELVRFGAPLNVVWNLYAYTLPNAVARGNARFVAGFLAANALANILVALMRGRIGGEDDDDGLTGRKVLYHGLLEGMTSAVPFSDIANLADWATERVVTGEKIPLYQMRTFPLAEAVGRGVVDVSEGNYKRAVIDAIEAAGFLKGAPSGFAKSVLRAVEKGSPGPLFGR